FARNLNVAFLVALAFAIAASANLPAILFSLFWKRFNTRGATWGIYAGLTAAQAKDCGVAQTSKEVSNATALFSCTTAAPIPLENPGLISIPLGFIFAALGALSSKERDEDKYAELEVRSLTGAGAN